MRYFMSALVLGIFVLIGMQTFQTIERSRARAEFEAKCTEADASNETLHARHGRSYCVRASAIVMRSE